MGLIDDGGPQVIFVDDADVALWVRVGVVYFPDGTEGDGVWIHYQTEHMASALHGPVLMMEDQWDELNAAVKERFAARKLDSTPSV